MASNQNEPLNYHDDNRVLRYLLQNVKGISPVSGGLLGGTLDGEYDESELAEAQISDELEFETEI